jgi:hypothetical protein
LNKRQNANGTERITKKDYKYQTYHINKSIFTGKLRDRFFEMALTDDVHHRKQLYGGFSGRNSAEVVPVIAGRRYKRKKKTGESIQQ